MRSLMGLSIALLLLLPANAAELEPLLNTIKNVGAKGAGHDDAAAAWQELARCDAADLPQLLAGLDDAGPLAGNWIRTAVDAVAERTVNGGGKLPLAALEKFALDTQHSPRARRLAFEWLSRVDATAPDRLIPTLLQDPSVEFRYDAVARLLAEAEQLKTTQPAAVADVFRRALSGARDLEQVKQIAAELKKLGQQVDLPKHFGFIMQWQVIGPFENAGGQGFDVAYPPESKVDFAAEHPGKGQAVKWKPAATLDDFGSVDFNEALGKHKDAVAYAAVEFVSAVEQPVEFRLGCPTASKLWLNGELIDSRRVYHSGGGMDQHISRGKLKPGRNLILLKVCQNAQTEEWAQVWSFQLRVCDPAGTAILSQDRPM
ncbi:MAG: hypothetical protein HY000_32600 [Planctomycetes bacterium]|nr:hypothetical protein [Planctomycetota bacterium]